MGLTLGSLTVLQKTCGFAHVPLLAGVVGGKHPTMPGGGRHSWNRSPGPSSQVGTVIVYP